MSLRWKEFERALRPQLDPLNPLRKWDWLRRLDHIQMSASLVRLIFSALLFIVLAFAAHQDASPSFFLTLIPLLSLFFAMAVANSFVSLPVSNPEYLAWWMLPLTEADILNRIRRVYGCFAVLSFVEFLPQYFLAFRGSITGASFFAVVVFAALAQALISVAVSALLAQNFKTTTFAGLILIASLTCSIKGYRQMWNPFAWTQELLRPSGHWLFAAPILALLATLPWSLRRCRQAHAALAFRVTPILVNGRPAMPRPSLQHRRPPPLTRETIANAAERTESAWSRQGVLPRLVSGLLRPRERHIGEAIFGVRPRWDAQFSACVGLLILFIILSPTLEFRIARQVITVLGLPFRYADYLFVTLGFMVVISLLASIVFAVSLFKIWRAPEQVGFQAEYRLLPVTHWDVSLVLAKTMGVFALLLLPLTVILSLSPLFLEAEHFANFKSLPLLPLFAWLYSFAVSLPAQRLTGRYFTWRDFFVFPKLMLLHGALLGLAYATFLQATRNALYLAGFVALSLGWFVWEGRRYWKRA
jgi:hypothetical protein